MMGGRKGIFCKIYSPASNEFKIRKSNLTFSAVSNPAGAVCETFTKSAPHPKFKTPDPKKINKLYKTGNR